MTDDNKTDRDENSKQQPEVNLEATRVAENNATSEDSSQASSIKASAVNQDHHNPAELFDAKPIPKMPAKKSKKGWIGKSLLILSVIAAILIATQAAFDQWYLKKEVADFKAELRDLVSAQSMAVEQAKNLSQQSLQAINQTQNQLNQLTAKIQQSDQMLLSTQERIKTLSGRQKQDWMLAEVAHLIKLAQLQLTLQKDKSTAIQLLKTADSRLIEISDNSLLPVREAIAQDLSELSLIMDSDVTGIAMSLSAITKAIEGLTLSAIQLQPQEKVSQAKQKTQQQPPAEGFDVHQLYRNFLKDFVVIKDYSEPVKPLITPEMRQNLVSNIQLALQQAQIALLQSRETLYRKHIGDAIHWIAEYYVKDNKSKNILTQLAQLRTAPVDVRYPSHLRSQKALQVVSQQQLYRWLESSLNNSPSFKKNNRTTPSIEPNSAASSAQEPQVSASDMAALDAKKQDNKATLQTDAKPTTEAPLVNESNSNPSLENNKEEKNQAHKDAQSEDKP